LPGAAHFCESCTGGDREPNFNATGSARFRLVNNARVNTSELLVWGCMLGGLLTIALVALADLLMSRSLASVRAMVFVLLLGSTSVLMTSLPSLIFTELPELALLTLQASLGPLCSAMALTYLALWLGVAVEDRMVHYLLTWGAVAQLVIAATLATWVALDTASQPDLYLQVGAIASAVGVAMALAATVRAKYLGDLLAGWMVLACIFLAGMVLGLYAFRLVPARFDWQTMALTVFCTIAYFLVVTALAVRRNRHNRQVQRLAGLARGADPATGLPTGSVLLSKVDDAFWRSSRRNGECTVVCLHLGNLYELGEKAGHSVDQQILSAVTARIRRAVGFRCVVGLYHPRCFVIVISGLRQETLVERSLDRLKMVLDKPLSVVGLDEAFHVFTPRYQLGVVTVAAAAADPIKVVDEAERRSLESTPRKADDAMPA
jgi:GGDEF domain-containing protein